FRPLRSCLLVLLGMPLGMGILLAPVSVAYRDFKVIVPLALQVWMFATPAIFLQQWESWLGPRLEMWLPLNPLHGVVVNFRAATLGGPLDVPSLALAAAWAAALLLCGCLYFHRVERNFAD